MKKIQPFDKDHHDLFGYAAVDFSDRQDFSSFATKLTGYNEDRFKPVALRMFIEKGKPVVTLYALDHTKQKSKGKLPVKKFKLRMELKEILTLVKRFDFTVTDGRYDLAKIDVSNK